MVIAKSMTAHSIRDIVQIKGELPTAHAAVPSIKGRKGHRHHHDLMGDQGSSHPSFDVIAGEDIPAHVIEGPVQAMPTLGRDLVSGCARNETSRRVDSSTLIFHVDGRLETRERSSLCRFVTSLRTAKDRHEQNCELLRDEDNPAVYCVRTIKQIRRGQPLFIWYEEGIAREIGVPVLTPANIRGNQEYLCTACHSTFSQPNVLKAHVFLECRHHHQAHQNHSTLVPFHSLLENISTCFTLSSAGNTNDVIKSESKTNGHCAAMKPLVVEISRGTKCDNFNEENISNSQNILKSPKLHYGHANRSRNVNVSNTECSQSELSPSLSSSSFDSSFLDENEEDVSAVNRPAVCQRLSIDCGSRSAFHRPSQSTKRRAAQKDTPQMPDSSTDQRSALNLSVKEDPYSILSNSNHHKNLFTSTVTHPWPNPRHIGVFPINYNTLPVYYPVSNRLHTPSTSFNYMAYYNQHQFPGTLNIPRDSFESNNVQTTTASLSGQPSPEREHSIQTMSFPSSESCPSLDNSVAPMNPYGLNLPSDKEPLDLLPQTYFTNKSKRGHLCLYCGKLYSRKYGLKIHMRTHNGYKPLKCKICSRPFGDPSNLNKHVRLHAQGETPYRCDYCGKVLVRRRDLERHVRSRHPLGTVTIDTSSPPSSPISVEDMDSSPFQENVSSL